jgi:hypothetical protein
LCRRSENKKQRSEEFIQKQLAAHALAHKVREALGKSELEDSDDFDQ